MFLYQFHPGERQELMTNPDAWTEADEKVFDQHYEYLRRGTEDGRIVLAGRSQDGVGPALVIIDIPDETDARHFMENDPFVESGLFTASLHPYRVAFQRDV
ncbi:MAG: YciI family protein [Acidimicrobiia bacterium]